MYVATTASILGLLLADASLSPLTGELKMADTTGRILYYGTIAGYRVTTMRTAAFHMAYVTEEEDYRASLVDQAEYEGPADYEELLAENRAILEAEQAEAEAEYQRLNWLRVNDEQAEVDYHDGLFNGPEWHINDDGDLFYADGIPF